MFIELLVCPTPSLSVISPVSRPHSRPRPGVLRAEGVDFAPPSLHAKSRSFEGKEAPGALGPVAAEVARVQPRLVVHLPAARTSIRGRQVVSRHPAWPHREPHRPCEMGRPERRSPMRCTRRSRTREHGPRCGRADGHGARHERSQGKLGRHPLVDPPPHGRVAAPRAIAKAPSRFVGNPTVYGAAVTFQGGPWDVDGRATSTVRTREAGGSGGGGAGER